MATPVLPTPAPRHGSVVQPRARKALHAATTAGRLLRDRGWSARLAEFPIVGETDVRLVAGPAGGAVVVELLCPCPDVPDGAGRWVAVRVRADEERSVWRGPGRTCGAARLVSFVDDLAREPLGVLEQRYEWCG